MIVFFRLLAVLWVCGKHRLDQLIDQPLPLLLRLLFSCFPVRSCNRGERLRLACEELGPVFVKFGQLLSTRPDMVPSDIVTELEKLQDRVPAFSSEEFIHIVEASLGQPLQNVFAQFDKPPLASASIAQVHTATLTNGQQVVIKVVRPGIEKIIAKDIALLIWIAKCLERWLRDGKRLRPVDIAHDYRNVIFDELDLQREAANASQLRRNFIHSSLLHVPEVIWQYSNQQMLVMERVYGIPVSDIPALKAQKTNMKLLAERGVEIFFTQVFDHNFFHADMHPGNIFVSTKHPQQPQYISVDMAIVGSLSRQDQYYLARNLLAMFRRDYRQVAELHVQSGWIPKDTSIVEFEAAVRTVCEPIFQKPLAEISFGNVLINLFMIARRFNMEVQPQLVLLQKTLLNIEGLGRQLYPELDLWQTAHPFLERWLKQHFHPKRLWKDLKRYLPEWVEGFPKIPTAVFDNLETLQQFKTLIPPIQQAVIDHQHLRVMQKRRYRKLALATVAGVVAVLTSSAQLLAHISSLPLVSIGLALLAVSLWLF